MESLVEDYMPTTMKKQAVTKFEEKQRQLDHIKKDFLRHQSGLNILRLHYRDFFDRKFQTFVDDIKTVQMAYGFLIPREIKSMRDFIETLTFIQSLAGNGHRIGRSLDRMNDFLGFWTRFQELQKEGERINSAMCDFCDSITRLREPELRVHLDNMQARLVQAGAEDFKFLHLHNEREHLFVYKIALHDDKFHPLVGYLPYLLKLATRICYYSGKLFIEKE